MSEAVLNAIAAQYLDLTLCKSRYDEIDIQWYTEGPFWRRTSMRFSRDYKILPDYEIADAKHGKTLEDILDESDHLLLELRNYQKQERPEERQRVQYLLDHIKALHTRTRILMGESMPFDRMTEDLYDLVAPEYDYRRFEQILEELNQALPGTGQVQDRICRFREQISIPKDRLLTVMQRTTMEFHRMSMEHMNLTGNSMPRVRVRKLPDPGMAFLSILFGYDYNHLEYERNFNLDYPWTVDNVLECIGHEMEPGHLTYYEKRTQTYIDTCWPEMAVVQQFSPSSAFTEGSARYAISMCFDHSAQQRTDFEREVIFKTAGLDGSLTELMPLWHEYCEIAGYAKLETTRKLWDRIWDCGEGAAFLKKYGVIGHEAQEESVLHLAADDGHFVAHDYARDIVKDYFNSMTQDVQKQWQLYETICCGHMSMSEMKAKTYRPL